MQALIIAPVIDWLTKRGYFLLIGYIQVTVFVIEKDRLIQKEWIRLIDYGQEIIFATLKDYQMLREYFLLIDFLITLTPQIGKIAYFRRNASG